LNRKFPISPLEFTVGAEKTLKRLAAGGFSFYFSFQREKED
jgi:hypothetical protein